MGAQFRSRAGRPFLFTVKTDRRRDMVRTRIFRHQPPRDNMRLGECFTKIEHG